MQKEWKQKYSDNVEIEELCHPPQQHIGGFLILELNAEPPFFTQCSTIVDLSGMSRECAARVQITSAFISIYCVSAFHFLIAFA